MSWLVVEPLERHGDRVYRLALRITGVEEEAAEAVEDTLRTAARTIHTLTGEPAFGSWIYRTAAKAAYQRLRARRGPSEYRSWSAPRSARGVDPGKDS